MALQKKAGAATAAAAAAPFNFLSPSAFGSGLGLANGKYALFTEIKMHHFIKKDGSVAGDDMLGVMITAYSLSNPGDEPKEQFYSMGKNAHKSFLPDETGKKLVPVPGGPGTILFQETNWWYFVKSLVDCGMPEAIGEAGDISAIDGVWVQTHQVPEPESRAAFRAQTTSEVGEDSKKRDNKIPIVSEILPNGAPWDGGGGMPQGAGEKKPAATAAKPGLQKKTLTKATPAPPPVEETAALEGVDQDVIEAVQSAIGTVLTTPANKKGMKKMAFKTAVMAALKADYDEATVVDMDQAVLSVNDNLNAVLGELGYALVGLEVKPQ